MKEVEVKARAKNLGKIRDLQKSLIKAGNEVSKLEYTEGNYDERGSLIKNKLPTITTEFCEIGSYKGNTYFVFIVESTSMTKKVLNILTKHKDVSIYGMKNFKENLYPKDRFNIKTFTEEAKKESHIQIQFNYKNLNARELFNKYQKATNIFKENNIRIFNQLEKDARKLI